MCNSGINSRDQCCQLKMLPNRGASTSETAAQGFEAAQFPVSPLKFYIDSDWVSKPRRPLFARDSRVKSSPIPRFGRGVGNTARDPLCVCQNFGWWPQHNTFDFIFNFICFPEYSPRHPPLTADLMLPLSIHKVFKVNIRQFSMLPSYLWRLVEMVLPLWDPTRQD